VFSASRQIFPKCAMIAFEFEAIHTKSTYKLCTEKLF